MSLNAQAEMYIQQFGMIPHPEGGYFVSTSRHQDMWTSNGAAKIRTRPLLTSIYYLLPSGQYSKWHTLLSDELWFYHDGSPILLHVFQPNGDYFCHSIGCPGDNHSGAKPMNHLPAGSVFGAECSEENSYSLVSCVVSPGFDFADFAFVAIDTLLMKYPEHSTVIRRLGE